jgi:hypothetical protein
VTKNGENEIEVWFKDGVPVSADNDNAQPTLVFKKNSNMFIAAFDKAFTQDTSAADLVINEVPSDLRCSFAGGCIYSIVSPGLTRTLTDTDNSSIEVCGNTCILDTDISNSGSTRCRLEPMVSRYSVETYDISEPAVLKGTWKGADGGKVTKLDDGVLTVDYNSNRSDCSYEFEAAKENYVYDISEVRFFINGFDKNMEHVDNLFF